MFREITPFLKKFSHLTPPEKSVRTHFITTVHELLGVSLREHEVVYRNNIIFLTTNPTVKSEIILHRGTLLRTLKEHVVGRNVEDIK